jgi:hypothetical protein
MPLQITNTSASFARPNNTTAYAAGQLVASSVTAGSVVPLKIDVGNAFPNGKTRITRARLFKSGISPANANFRIHLYDTIPTPANGDGAAWSTDQAAHWLGNIDVTSMLAFTDGCAGTGSATAGSEMFLALAGKSIWALLEAKAAYTPVANETFAVTLEDLSSW